MVLASCTQPDSGWNQVADTTHLLPESPSTEGEPPGGETAGEEEQSEDAAGEDASGEDAAGGDADGTAEGGAEEEERDLSDASTESQATILFVGNSLTYFNDLPELVRLASKSYGVEVTTVMQAYPAYALEDHWALGKMQDRIVEGDIDFLVIQQGPSSQAYGRETLFEYGQIMDALCRQYDTRLAYFMVWPSRVYYHTFDAVIANYRDAAASNGAILCPVGAEWKEHFDQTADFSYYGPDAFHPSLKGSQVAAGIIARSLFGNGRR